MEEIIENFVIGILGYLVTAFLLDPTGFMLGLLIGLVILVLLKK